MKKILISLAALVALSTSASAVSFSWVSSKLFGDGTLKSYKNEVEAHGYNIRTYTWVNPAGQICSVVFTDEKGGNGVCEFPPAEFDMDKFIKGMK